MITVQVYVVKSEVGSRDGGVAKIVKRNRMGSKRSNEILVRPGETWTTELHYPATLTIHDTAVYDD